MQLSTLENAGRRIAARHGMLRGRKMTCDEMMTYDRMAGDSPFNKRLPRFQTHDNKTCDSTGAFFVSELERLDQTMHGPLAAVTWGRDIDLREDVTLGDEISSFTQSTFASAGGLGAGNSIGNGKAWMGKNTTQVTGVSVDIAKIVQPLNIWGMELKYSIPELESAARLGRPVDVQKFEGLQLKHQMDIDEQVYIGDTSLTTPAQPILGLVNASVANGGPVVATNVATGSLGSTTWALKSADEILADINQALTSVWTASAWAVMSNRILIPPAQYGLLATAKVSLAGNESIMKYVLENNLLAKSGGPKLEIFPCKWCIGAAAGGTIGTLGTGDRMVVYLKEKNRVRFPMTMLQRTPIQYDSIYHKSTYYCRLGTLEIVYGSTIGYFDGI